MKKLNLPKYNKFINQLDRFGQEMPTFNYKGQTTLGTPFGLLGTILFTVLLSLYATSKFVHLVTLKNPLITKASETEKHLTDDSAIDLDTTDFQMAFLVHDMKTNEPKDDKAYVTWHGGIFESDGKKEKMVQKIGVHKCTKQDLEKFYPAGVKSKDKINDLKRRDALQCFDDVDVNGKKINRKLFGSSDSQPNRTLMVQMSPCIPK